MTVFTDGKSTVEVSMHEWNGYDWGTSLEADILCNDSAIAYNYLIEAWVVDDVDYLKSLVSDWQMCEGEYAEDMASADDRMVIIDDVVTM